MAGGGGGAEGGVVVVGDGLVEGADGDDVRNILVAVVQEEGGALAVLAEAEGARGDGLGGIPNKLLVNVPRAIRKELLDAEVVLVKELRIGYLAVAVHLLVEDAAAKTVVTHRDDDTPLRPTDGAILGVVFHLPDVGLGEDGGLVTIEVIGRREGVDGRVLVEAVGHIIAAFGGGAVADVVVGIGETLSGDKLVAEVVGIGLRLGIHHHAGLHDLHVMGRNCIYRLFHIEHN